MIFPLNRASTVIKMCFKEKDISVTVRGGENVRKNPSLSSPADFEWKSNSHGYFKSRGNQTIFDFEVEGTRFKGTFDQPVHWDNKKEGTSSKLSEIKKLTSHSSLLINKAQHLT